MNENPKGKHPGRRRLIRIAFSLLSIAVLTYIAIMLITGRQSSLFRLFGSRSDQSSFEMADEYYFDVGRNRVFANLNGSPAAAGTLGIQVFDAGGAETLRDSFRMTSPAIYAQNGYAVSFDINGTAARVFTKTQIVSSIETNGPIISATINKNGWTAICTQDGVSRGVVTVYDSTGKAVYRVSLATGYVLSAALSQDNKGMAILNLTPEGSRVSYYNLNSENVDRTFDLPSGLALNLWYDSNDDLLLISSQALNKVDKNNECSEIYGFAGKHLRGYAIDEDYIVLYLLDYNVGHSGRLVALSSDGSHVEEMTTEKEIISLSLSDGYLAVLQSDGFAFYDTDFERLLILGQYALAAGAGKVLSIGGGKIGRAHV